MNILIVGASGLIGSHLADQCDKRSSWKSIGTFFGTPERNFLPLDITNADSVREVFKKTQPQIVFLTAFNPNVDYCEEHPKETEITNIVGNRNIIDMSSQYNAKVVYFSSDFVFDGKNGPYNEDDQPSPICVYGKQKLAIEQYIENSLADIIESGPYAARRLDYPALKCAACYPHYYPLTLVIPARFVIPAKAGIQPFNSQSTAQYFFIHHATSSITTSATWPGISYSAGVPFPLPSINR